ncbi:hypothetical protein L6164_006268 [Bauhinia variegata]|uniref:Uncharacterized protein n=1 Tax=Bauhinia variegata TaxID=167791 RepID=A0ACB9PT93_BAUVA|nr:hypothetical protein L6164_006268 [Bauhinia variegata]
MGREIVRQESPSEPGKRSRLWDHQDVLQVLSENIGSDRIQCLLVDLPDQYMVNLSDETFEMMTNLRVLIVRNAQFYGSPQRLPWSLRLLDWMEYPLISLQSRKVALLNLHHNGLSKPVPLEIGTVKCCGIHLYNEGMNIHVVSFMNSGLRGSNLVYEKVDGALGIFEEEEDEDEEEEEEYGNDDLEADELTISINHQIPESYETETRSKEKGVSVYGSNAEETLDDKLNKLFLGSSSLATSIYENKKKLELWSKGKLKDNIVQVQASTSKCNCYDKAERTQIQVPEKRASEEFSQIEDNMEAFYASIEAKSSILPLLQDSVNTRPSEETEKKLQNLQDLILKNFSLLLHPERSGHLKNVLDYLLSLSPEDGISLKMRSAMLRLSTTFSQWSSDYNGANLKLESATEILSNVKKLEEGLETNVKEFRKAEKSGNAVCSELANLKPRKRELKEQINAMKAEIADLKLARDDAVQRKRELFEKGRMIKAQKDYLENKVPQLRAEQEGARITLATIESEWSKLVQQFFEGFFSSPLLASLN